MILTIVKIWNTYNLIEYSRGIPSGQPFWYIFIILKFHQMYYKLPCCWWIKSLYIFQRSINFQNGQIMTKNQMKSHCHQRPAGSRSAGFACKFLLLCTSFAGLVYANFRKPARIAWLPVRYAQKQCSFIPRTAVNLIKVLQNDEQ